MVIDLIEKFMEAGFCRIRHSRMMNSRHGTHGEHNLFSTVDLMRLDRQWRGGVLQNWCRHDVYPPWKRGADGHTEEHAGRVFVGQQVPKVTEQLADGDFVIMVTDGVLEHLHVRDAGETICEVIRGITQNNAAEFSRLVLNRCCSIPVAVSGTI